MRTRRREAEIPGPEVPNDRRDEQREHHREAGGTADLKDQLDRQQRDDPEGYGSARQQNAEEVETSRPDNSDLSWQKVRVDNCRHGVCSVMKAVDELEAESDQQRHEEEQERQKRRDSGAAGIDVCIEAVRDEEQASSEQAQKDHGGARIELPVQARTNRNGSSPRPCTDSNRPDLGLTPKPPRAANRRFKETRRCREAQSAMQA